MQVVPASEVFVFDALRLVVVRIGSPTTHVTPPISGEVTLPGSLKVLISVVPASVPSDSHNAPLPVELRYVLR